MPNHPTKRRAALACAALLALGASSSRPVDLDVGIPPGSPTSWGRRFPAITPRRGPMFPTTPVRGAPADGAGAGAGQETPDPTRTVVQRPTAEFDVGIASSFGIVRILTWDLTSHLPWTRGTGAPPTGPVTGPAAKAAELPRAGEPLHWACTAALLRLLLHPQLVSEPEVVAHLVEIGEPALAVLDSAATEPALAKVCDRVKKLVTARRIAAAPVAGATPRESMLLRFLADELVTAHPYDPEGGFGRRFLLLGAEAIPLLEKHLAAADAFVRRNAAAGLGRFADQRAVAALFGAAVGTEDPVVRMRALAAIGDHGLRGDPAPLLALLDRSDDLVTRVALLECLGRIGAADLRPRLLALGDRALRGDPDLLQAVLAALVRLANGPGDADVGAFARRVARACENPGRFEVRRAEPAPQPDRPDTGATRGEVVDQLTRLLQARLGVDGAAERVLELAPEVRRRAAAPRRRAAEYANRALGDVHPPAQILFLETLRSLGDRGHAALRSIAEDPTTEPALRGQALAQLPFSIRGDVAAALCMEGRGGEEMRIYAFEVLASDGHDRLRGIGKELLAQCTRVPSGAATAAQRYLWLCAVRAFDRRGWLRADELIALLHHLAPPGPDAARIAAAAGKEVRRLVELLVRDAASEPRRVTRERLDEVLSLVVDARLNEKVAAADRDDVRDELRKMLEGLRGHRADQPYQQAVQTAVLEFLLGAAPVVETDRSRFEPPVLLEEQVVLALGRTRAPETVIALRRILGDADHPLRAEACLAAGLAGDKALWVDVAGRLLDDDGFVRLCASEALRHLTGQHFDVDWIYGSAAERGDAAQEWHRWCVRNR